MPYISDRFVHDADAHVMEPPGWIGPYSDPGLRDRLLKLTPDFGTSETAAKALAAYDDPDYRARSEAEITLRKNHEALGAIRKDDRPTALDYLGVKSQLMFTSMGLLGQTRANATGDPDLIYGYARAHNRAMVDFCSVDHRLLPTLEVPLEDIDRACAMAIEAIEMGAAALMVPSACPANHSPSHIGLDPIWAEAAAAGIPVLFHVGLETHVNPVYLKNGMGRIKDFHGGDGSYTSVSYMAIAESAMQSLATMIFDGVLERHPSLRFGVIEMGAAWLPGLMRSMDAAADAFRKNEERLKSLSLKPSEFVQRQLRVTPYPHEPAGWIIKQTGADVPMFSTDYPHIEGGRNPYRRFKDSLAAESVTEAERDAFYRWNFEDFMGKALEPVLSRL